MAGRQVPTSQSHRRRHRGGRIPLQERQSSDRSKTEGHLDVSALLFSFSAPLIDWPESDLKLVTAVWVGSYKNAWNLGKSTATCLFTFPREKGGLQVKLPLGTLLTSVWGNLERCSQFDDGTRHMLAMCYQEALQENGCLDLLELQDASWKAASTNEVTIACYLANKLDNTGPIPHRPYCICSRCHSGSPRMPS